MAVAPKRFQSSDSGAPALSGQVGKMLDVLDACLCINKMYTAVSGASFVDNSVEARLQAGTSFKLFQGPTSGNDEAYFGMAQKFEQIVFKFGTAGVQNATITLTWEYWNGSAWTSFTPDTDGTTKFTADGTVAWTIANLSSWATTAVNSVTLYWVRVRFTAGSWTTNPLVNTSVWAWTRAYSGTNIAAYQQGAGNGFYLRVDDSGPGSAGAQEGRLVSYETMSDVNTGTKPCPTAAQFANGLFFRKSAAANGTARTWQVFCDDRTFRVYVLTTDVSNVYFTFRYGQIYSKVSSDPYGVLIVGRTTEANAGGGVDNLGILTALNTLATGHYLQRDYQGSAGGAVQAGKHGDGVKGNTTGLIGTVPYLNGPDGGLYLAPIWIHEASSQVRGRERGLWEFLHAIGSLSDGDTFSGTASDGLNGRSFVFLKTIPAGSGGNIAVAIEETSNTWETN